MVTDDERPADGPEAPPDDSAGEVVRAYLSRHVQRLLTTVRAAHQGDEDAVHDARVATRRLRTALGVYRPVLDRATTDPLRAQLRELGHRLGNVRDPFVELRALRRALAAEPAELVLGGVARRIEEDRSAARSAALEHLRSLLDDERTAALFAALQSLGEVELTGPHSGDDAAALLRRARKAWRRMDRALDEAGGPDAGDYRDELLHAARKAARRARYAAEVLVPVVGKPARR